MGNIYLFTDNMVKNKIFTELDFRTSQEKLHSDIRAGVQVIKQSRIVPAVQDNCKVKLHEDMDPAVLTAKAGHAYGSSKKAYFVKLKVERRAIWPFKQRMTG